MADYDISKAFETIENELIDSMMRNFKHHRAEEEEEGYNWSQWQSEQLKSLEQYRRTNQKKYGKQFSTLNKKIEEMLKTAMADGNAKQETEILKAIKKGFKVGKVGPSATGEFFKVNDRKLDALINATKSDMEKAETAILRMSNDKYRKAIFNAQVYANSGAGTYEKAVDMAVKDMLQAGLNCVEYRNGARHTLSDYADMAIRTANKRAYLYGEGQKRQEWGISLVVVNSRQGGCPDCAQYIGRVFIDDVYSGGSKADGNYPLLSEAIAGGLFHPRCKDSTSTYYEGITSLEPVSSEELAQMEERETLETKQQNAERQEKRYNRLAQHSLDEDNKIKYQNRADGWHTSNEKYKEKLDEVIENSVENSSESGIIKIETFNSKGDPMYEVMGSAFESNPKEVQEIIEQLKEWGVGINYGSSTLAYGCTQRGKPGTLSITKNASYSAWLHEFQHIKDDYEDGWNGIITLLFNLEERERRERKAYAIEINLAKEMGREDIVKRLEANLNEEINAIYKETSKYK